MKERINSGERLSITFDEYTSKRNRCYLTINLHSKSNSEKPINLGMIRVEGTQDAGSIERLVEKRLEIFGLELNQIVCMTTNGASIMVSLGEKAKPSQQV